MTRRMFESLPTEVVSAILEILCTELVDELANIGEKEAPHFGAKLREFRNLLLVSRQFRNLLYGNAVRVNSSPIRQCLISLQMWAFCTILNLFQEIPECQRRKAWCDRPQYWEAPNLQQFERRCGSFWSNPGFGKVFPRLVYHQEWVPSSVIEWCMYQVPLKLPRFLQTSGGDRKGLICGRNYQINSFRFRFTAGRFGQRFESNKSVWTGTSLLRFCEKGKTPTEGKEDQYWLWFGNNRGFQRCVVVDYEKMTVGGSDISWLHRRSYWKGDKHFDDEFWENDDSDEEEDLVTDYGDEFWSDDDSDEEED